jgi:CBS domain-containing protein
MSKTVRDAMTSQPVTIEPSASVKSAAELMARQDIGSLPVVDERGSLVGMVTDRDIAIRAVAAGRDAGATQVKEILTSPTVQVIPEDPLDLALELMAKHQVRRLPVVYDTQLVGVLAQADIAHEAKDKQAGQVLEAISQPTPEHAHA